MATSGELYRYLFDLDASGAPESAFRHWLVDNYRFRRIDSGSMREFEIFPILPAAQTRRAREHATREAQAKQNAKDAIKKFTRLVHANFADGLHVSLTYDRSASEDDAKHDARNYIKRVRPQAQKQGKELRYMYLVEHNEKSDRVHIHMLITGVDRDTCEAQWHNGYVNADRIRQSDQLLTDLCGYLSKGPRGKRRWNRSKNLITPIVRASDKRLSKHKVVRICTDVAVEGKQIFEAMNPGYRLMEPITPKYSDIIAGAYIYVRMRREPAPNAVIPVREAWVSRGTPGKTKRGHVDTVKHRKKEGPT